MDIKKAITVISRIEEGLPLLSVSILIFIVLRRLRRLRRKFRFCELLQQLGRKCRTQERDRDEYAVITF